MATEHADAMSYLINPKSSARVRREAILAIEKILIAMASDPGLRFADTKWHPRSRRLIEKLHERVREYEGMFRNEQGGIPFSIFMLRIAGFLIRSNGPDRIENTDDDVTSQE